jgi:hypothetical protein
MPSGSGREPHPRQILSRTSGHHHLRQPMLYARFPHFGRTFFNTDTTGPPSASMDSTPHRTFKPAAPSHSRRTPPPDILPGAEYVGYLPGGIFALGRGLEYMEAPSFTGQDPTSSNVRHHRDPCGSMAPQCSTGHAPGAVL